MCLAFVGEITDICVFTILHNVFSKLYFFSTLDGRVESPLYVAINGVLYCDFGSASGMFHTLVSTA